MLPLDHREGPAPPRRTTPVPFATKHSCPFCGLSPVRGGHQCKTCGTWRPRERELPRFLWSRKGSEELTETEEPEELDDQEEEHDSDPEEPTELDEDQFTSDFEFADEY